MRYLNKIIFLNSAHVPYAEVKLDGNVHFIGTQGVGKSTLLRAVLFFYNADKLRLGIPKEKKNFDSFYLPFANSYIVYEVMRENGAYTIVVTKSMGRAAFRFIDAPYSKEWFVDGKNEVSADWSVIRTRVSESGANVSSLVTGYDMFRDIIFGNNRKPDLLQFRKYAIVESSRYQNIPRTIQNVFLNSKLDADFIKDTIIQSMDDNEFVVDLSYYRNQIETFEQEYSDVMLWIKQDKNGVVPVRKQADIVIKGYRMLLFAEKQIKNGRQQLNYSERVARLKFPELEELLLQLKEEAERFTRLLGEEKYKFDSERDKLVKLSGIVESDLKKIREKRKYYEQEHIDEVISRVNREPALKYELESLNKVYNELTSTYRDVISKYSLMEQGIDALRINPGNIGSRDNVVKVVDMAREKQIPIRIGINAGSLPQHILDAYGGHPTAEGMVAGAMEHVKILEEENFHDIVISVKSTDVPMMVKANRLLHEQVNYPLHLGVTEAGTLYRGTIKSAIGIGSLLLDGIGDTIRVSLTDDPLKEVKAAKEILSSVGMQQYGPVLVSCPTCGRTQVDLIHMAQEVEEKIQKFKKPIRVAVMGCAVNGPGEAREADFGIAGGKGSGLLFRKGKILRSVPEEELIPALMEEIEKFENQ